MQVAEATGLSGNSCGYGALNTFQWPFLAGVTMSAQASLLKGAPMGGCGSCFEIQCDPLVSTGTVFVQPFAVNCYNGSDVPSPCRVPALLAASSWC